MRQGTKFRTVSFNAGKCRRTTSRPKEPATAQARRYAERIVENPSRLQRDDLTAPHNPSLGIRRFMQSTA
jgi:hypothetical protein